MLNRGQDIIGWQVLLQKQSAALITALRERAYVCMSTPARLSLSAKFHKTCNAMVCSAMKHAAGACMPRVVQTPL